MITAPVTREQLERRKKLWSENISSLKPNRITGRQLNEYFCQKYSPAVFEDDGFKEVVKFNLMQEYGAKAGAGAKIVCYTADRDIYVGIDLDTGFFHIESQRIEACVPIYNDLYVKRGLNERDLQNYVLTGQYLELLND